jgi:hypothetical protein
MFSGHQNFKLNASGRITDAFLSKGIIDFSTVIHAIRHLPHGRISDRNNPLLVLEEKKGTYSSKRTLLALLAHENERPEVQLMEIPFEMNEKNTPSAANVLSDYGLIFIPELYNYLHVGNIAVDATAAHFSNKYSAYRTAKYFISPFRSADEKISIYKNHINNWQTKNGVAFRYPAQHLCDIREECISTLSNTHKRTQAQ